LIQSTTRRLTSGKALNTGTLAGAMPILAKELELAIADAAPMVRANDANRANNAGAGASNELLPKVEYNAASLGGQSVPVSSAYMISASQVVTFVFNRFQSKAEMPIASF
jgi:hypothetical protein